MADQTSTERLLDGAEPSSSAAASSAHFPYRNDYRNDRDQQGHRDYHDFYQRTQEDDDGNSDGRGGSGGSLIGVAVRGGTGREKVPFLLPHAAVPVAVRPAGDQCHLHRQTNAGKGGSVMSVSGKPASLQLPLRLGGNDDVDESTGAFRMNVASKEGDCSPRSRRRAHTALSYFEPECIICLEPFSSKNPRIKSKCRCGTYSTANSMHLACLFAWIEQQGGKQICPVCRDHIAFDRSD